MPDSKPRLPARPSLEQLQKQAKELLRRYRAGDESAAQRLHAAIPQFAAGGHSPAASLAGAQFVLACEHGFKSWAVLKHHIESLRPPGLEQFERLAKDLAAAYTSGNAMAIREINWDLGTSFVWDHEPLAMQQRLKTWFASGTRNPELALADAQRMVAGSYGFESWAKFVESVAQGQGGRHPTPAGMSPAPPFYTANWKESAISVRGPMSEKGWDTICEVMKEHRITRLSAGGMTDAGMERVTRLNHVKYLDLDNSNQLTDEGLRHLARMPQLLALNISGVKGVITDRGLDVLRHLPELRHFQMAWQQNVSDGGVANLAFCGHLESVNLMGTPTGDGAVHALAGKPKLRQFKTGRNVTDAGLPLFRQFPLFKRWQGGEIRYGLMSFDSEPTHLMIDGPFTGIGVASLAGLDGLFGMSFFWHCAALTAEGLKPLRDLSNLGFFGCDGKLCDDEAMRFIAEIPRLRVLVAQGTVATDVGFAALSRSHSLEHLWGRECPNLTGSGFAALAAMPALRGLAVSCKNVDEPALAALPNFPSLREFVAIGLSDDGFRHVGRCEQLEGLWCMYCRDTGDIATGHIAGLSSMKTYYAGQTQITDRSLEILGRMQSLERLEFWACAGLTNEGIGHLARLPGLREISLDGLPGVTREVVALFPAHVRVNYSG